MFNSRQSRPPLRQLPECAATSVLLARPPGHAQQFSLLGSLRSRLCSCTASGLGSRANSPPVGA